MGYEICFKYYKKKSEGVGYDTEGEPEVMKVSVGKQWDDVDLNEVAKTCFGQMAKRNILIVDAEIYEYAKKKVSFKMKDDGITIKNRKFSYDITGALNSSEDGTEQQLQPHEVKKTQSLVAQPVKESRLVPEGVPIRYEIYDPHPDLVKVALQKGLAFTIGKRYPIFQEKPDMRGIQYGMIYYTTDDNGNKQAINDKHFVPTQNLTNGFGSEARPNHISSPASEDGLITVNGKNMHLPDVYTLGRRK